MHCETTVDPSGTWRESYRALERAYAEGRVMAIGVSNFDDRLLAEITDMASTLPHVVQNHADPARLDQLVRDWCRRNDVLFQPYAVQRNLKSLPRHLMATLERISASRNQTLNAVVLKFYHQTGAVLIPRSTNTAHLSANLNLGEWTLSPEEMNLLGWKEGADKLPSGGSKSEL